jgi:hypothetical protein
MSTLVHLSSELPTVAGMGVYTGIGRLPQQGSFWHVRITAEDQNALDAKFEQMRSRTVYRRSSADL